MTEPENIDSKLKIKEGKKGDDKKKEKKNVKKR